MRLGRRHFDRRELVVMAVVNRTPDSFADRGATFALPAALAAVDRAVADGAGIVDVGGVPAGSGPPVDEAEELARTRELVVEARRRHPDLVISVDTWRARVAEALLAAGADVVNDAWGAPDPDILRVAAAARAGYVATHAGGLRPRTDPHRVAYADVMAEVVDHCRRLADRAVAAGVSPESLLVDPGHDFGKTTRHSLEVTRRLGELVALGHPVLVSLSRKDFVGETLDRPVADRLTGTLAATAVCACLGARVFRSHDVAATVETLAMVASIAGSREPAVSRRGLA